MDSVCNFTSKMCFKNFISLSLAHNQDALKTKQKEKIITLNDQDTEKEQRWVLSGGLTI